MKRIIPILLILAMLLSFAVTAHAEEAPTDTVTMTAPTLCSVQTAVNATDETLHDVRFLATVSDLRGTALGMEIRANFVSGGEQKSVLYNAADGLEGSTVYSSVKETVNGVTKSVTAAELAGDANAKGIFAAIIKGVPSNLTVTFSVTVYVKDGETVVSSPVTMAVDKNGVFAEVALNQNFDTATTLEEAGISKTIAATSKCGGWDVKVVDGKLSVPKHSWHTNEDYYLTLADANTLKAAKTYLLEMDLTFTELATFCLILNGNNKLTADCKSNQAGAMGVALRQDKGTDGKFYDTYDVHTLLRQGKNCIGLLLGNGISNAIGGFVWDFDKASFRSAPQVALSFEAVCGEKTLCFEADETFRCAPSPIIFDDLRSGEHYNATLEIDG